MGVGVVGRRSASVYLGENVEVLNVASVAEPFLVFLHDGIEYQMSKKFNNVREGMRQIWGKDDRDEEGYLGRAALNSVIRVISIHIPIID